MIVDKTTHGAIALGKAVRELYAEGQVDYSLEPIVMTNKRGDSVGRIKDGDAVIFCCRRGEREIQLTGAFTEAGYDHFRDPTFRISRS